MPNIETTPAQPAPEQLGAVDPSQLILESQQRQQELISAAVPDAEGLSAASTREIRRQGAIDAGRVALRANGISGKTGFAGLAEAEKTITGREVEAVDYAEISRQNDQAHLEIYGSGNRTLFASEDTDQKGAPIATPEKPIKGILQQMTEKPNSMLGKPMSVRKRAERQRAKEAKAYEEELLGLVNDPVSPLELSQAKLVMDLRAQDKKAKASFIDKLRQDGLTKKAAELKAAEVYDKKDQTRLDLIRSKNIYSKDAYDTAINSSPKKVKKPEEKPPKEPTPEELFKAKRDELTISLARAEHAYAQIKSSKDAESEENKQNLAAIIQLEKEIRDELRGLFDQTKGIKPEQEWDTVATNKEKMLNKANGMPDDYEPVPEPDELPYEGKPAEGRGSRAKKKISKFFGSDNRNYGVTFDKLGQATVHTSGAGKTRGGKVTFGPNGKPVIEKGTWQSAGKTTKLHDERLRIIEASADNRRSVVAMAIGLVAVDKANEKPNKKSEKDAKANKAIEAKAEPENPKPTEEITPVVIPDNFEDMTPESIESLLSAMENDEPETVGKIRDNMRRDIAVRELKEKVNLDESDEDATGVKSLISGLTDILQKNDQELIKKLHEAYLNKKSS